MNAKITRAEAERLVDNTFQRLLILVDTVVRDREMAVKVREVVETERATARAVIRRIRGCPGSTDPRQGGTVEAGGGH